MKRTLILLGLMLLVGVGSVFAQRGGIGGGRPSGGGGGGIGNRPSQGLPPQGLPRNGGTSQRPPNSENRNGGPGQPGGNSTERRREQPINHGKLLKGLDLSREQKHQIKEIQKAAKENGTSPEEVRSQIAQVLTPEQKAKLKERIEKIKERKDQPKEPNQPQ